MKHQLIQTFEENYSALYSLAFLLTGNADRGIEAFHKALDVEEDENPAFGGFMTEWARKLIVVEALGTMVKELRISRERTARLANSEPSKNPAWTKLPYIAREQFEEAVISIDAFPRCAMLLTIFEGMSVQAVSVLLNAGEALTRAGQRMGIVQLTRNLTRGRDPQSESGLLPVPVLSLS